MDKVIEPGIFERSIPMESTPFWIASKPKNRMEDLADDWMRNGQKPAYNPATPLAFMIARVHSIGVLYPCNCICVPRVSRGIVKQQSIAPAAPPAASVRQPPFDLLLIVHTKLPFNYLPTLPLQL